MLCPSSADHDARAYHDGSANDNAGPDHDAGPDNVYRPSGIGQHDRPESAAGAHAALVQVTRLSVAFPQLLGCD